MDDINPAGMARSAMDAASVGSAIPDLVARIRTEVGRAVTGQANTVDLVITALLSGGHILLEGPPAGRPRAVHP